MIRAWSCTDPYSITVATFLLGPLLRFLHRVFSSWILASIPSLWVTAFIHYPPFVAQYFFLDLYTS